MVEFYQQRDDDGLPTAGGGTSGSAAGRKSLKELLAASVREHKSTAELGEFLTFRVHGLLGRLFRAAPADPDVIVEPSLDKARARLPHLVARARENLIATITKNDKVDGAVALVDWQALEVLCALAQQGLDAAQKFGELGVDDEFSREEAAQLAQVDIHRPLPERQTVAQRREALRRLASAPAASGTDTEEDASVGDWLEKALASLSEDEAPERQPRAGMAAEHAADDAAGGEKNQETIAQYLPLLRRYARALTGSQGAGDAYVAAVLEHVIEHSAIITEAIITDESPLRVVLYLLVTGEVKLGLSASKLAKAVPMAQQAYLLTALEGFSQGDAARILDVDVVELRALIEQAIRGLGAEPGTDVLIVTDDTFEALQLETLVGHLGHRVAGLAHTHAEAVALAKAKPPGLILVDAEGSFGREVEELLRSFAARMIVVAGAPERFLTGERPEPTFVIGKPLTPPAVAAVASQALFFESLTEHRQALSAKPA